ncbi:phytoene/squalene synthase family protein [Saccharothrix algeriensis]|nr:phytoene/squalene synthase family protein [Saccharothrix algeriensis]QTR06516.1 phytoene/squalene synthase family protein [Saccharothrix algeriensis]
MSVDRELDAAAITDPALRAAYQRCRALNAVHGRTYYLATRLLSPGRRPAVHALYGFARWVDDIVDEVHDGRTPDERAAELARLDAALAEGLATGSGPHPVVAAVVDTARRYGIPHRHFHDFMASMRMDLTVTDYADYAALSRYVHGSAAVIGLQVLPVLGTCVPQEEAEPAAAALGVAFQLTNFLRDVGEDLDRGRVYLPADELAAFGVDRELLMWARRSGRTDPRIRRALAHQVARTRAVYREAEPGVGMLARRSRPCVDTAFRLYGRILDLIEQADYDIVSRRVVVSRRGRLAVALPAFARAALAAAG